MANWAAIGALGQAASGAGDYFGIVAADKKKADMLAQARAEKLDDRKYEESTYQRRREEGIGDKADLRKTITEEGVENTAAERELGLVNAPEDNAASVAEKLALDNASDGGFSGKFHVDQTTGEVSKINKKGDLIATGRTELTDAEIASQKYTLEELEEEKQYQLDLTREAQEAQADLEKNGFEFSEAQSKIYIHYGNGMAGLANAEKSLNEGPQGGMDNMIRQLGDGKITSNWMQTPAAQRYQQGMLAMTEATLRHKSGAAIKDDEILKEMKKYMIEVGDDASTILQKRDDAQNAVDLLGDTLPKKARELAVSRISTTDYSAPDAVLANETSLDKAQASSRGHGASAASGSPGLSSNANKYLDL